MQRILNYGSFFQAYSLKTILESLGHEVVFVDYRVEWPIALKHSYKTKSLRHLRMIKRMILHPYHYDKKKDPLYEFFLPCYKLLGLSPTYHFREKVDVLVVGSDEVFNCLQENPDVGYSMELFGKNNNAKKLISYAASFGDTTLQRLKNYEVHEEIGAYLKRFDAISVRDNNSSEIVEKLCGIIPDQHFDPALISNLEELKWRECNLDHFMVVYGYKRRFSEEEGAAIMSFAQKRQLKVVILNASQIFGDVLIRCRPDEILGYFAKAEYVVTDTFHGTIFSVLYHKPFAVLCRTPDDTHYSNQNKLIDLIEKLQLEEQHVTRPENIGETLEREIDYNAIDRIRVVERERALSYLRKECGEENGNSTDL
ncbi:MAG: polysaccharide pyruvyl transferase family protein [Oscillospiraceae bacterium]|nr:polysaccharide pyruvyl transferase family protein [Oscillospiraceae bacterium]